LPLVDPQAAARAAAAVKAAAAIARLAPWDFVIIWIASRPGRKLFRNVPATT